MLGKGFYFLQYFSLFLGYFLCETINSPTTIRSFIGKFSRFGTKLRYWGWAIIPYTWYMCYSPYRPQPFVDHDVDCFLLCAGSRENIQSNLNRNSRICGTCKPLFLSAPTLLFVMLLLHVTPCQPARSMFLQPVSSHNLWSHHSSHTCYRCLSSGRSSWKYR